MASYNPASGAWTGEYDEFGNVVWRNQNARQVLHMHNMPRQQPPPPPPFYSRGAFVPETRYPHCPPGPGFTSPVRPPAGFPPLQERGPTERITPLTFPPNNLTGPAVARQTPPPTLLEEAKHWTQQRNANGEIYYLNTLTMEWQLETPDGLKKYTTKRLS